MTETRNRFHMLLASIALALALLPLTRGDPAVHPVTTDGGTAGQLPLFSAHAQLAPSSVTESAGSIGIGTALPSQRLEVAGNVLVAPSEFVGAVYLGNTAHGLRRNLSPGNNVELFTTNGDLAIMGGKVGLGTKTPATELHVAIANGPAVVRLSPDSLSDSAVEFMGGTPDVQRGKIGWDVSDAAFKMVASPSFDDDHVVLSSSGKLGLGTASPESTLHVPDGKYAQFADANAGAPPSADCDADAERGRLSMDTTNHRLYVCNGASRGWDHADLTD